MTTSGTLKSFTTTSGGFAFTVLTDPNPSPPPPTIETTFSDVPAWVKEAVLPNVGKQVDVGHTGTPPTVSSVTVRAS